MATAAWAFETIPELTDRELAAITKLVYEKSGITLHDGKRALVTARLQKRVKQGGFRNFAEYLAFVKADGSGDELTRLIDAIATNHTSFFREPSHFTFLRDVVLPPLAASGGRKPVRAWSAACSSGEEPYTIAMTVVDSWTGAAGPSLQLLASDLSTKVLAAARSGVYKAERVADLPHEVLKRHFEKGLGAQAGLVRVGSHLRRLVEFRQVNLLEVPSLGQFDFVFCRNVMIYFDRQVQQRVVSALERCLAPGGYLFISHSESLNGIGHDLTWTAPAIYRKGAR